MALPALPTVAYVSCEGDNDASQFQVVCESMISTRRVRRMMTECVSALDRAEGAAALGRALAVSLSIP
jgi:hypothetical protein